MAIFSGGKSTAINSPRHLTLRHARKVAEAQRRELNLPGPAEAGALQVMSLPSPSKAVAFAVATVDEDEDPDPLDSVELKPGEEKLNSFWAPGLIAGRAHHIKVRQEIDAKNAVGDKPSEKLRLTAEQEFFVDAPQFSLPDGSVHSVHPPAGYADDAWVLPHVVLTDPHLPWERDGSPLTEGENDPDPRNRVPWLVLVSFQQDELRLPPEDLEGIFKATSAGVIKPVKQSPTMTVSTSIADLWSLGSDDVTSPVTSDLGPASMKDSRGDFVFLKPDLFRDLFSKFEAGKRIDSATPDTTAYRFMSHVRKINGSGMALAGVEDTAIFSIVVGSRAGPLDIKTPTVVSTHLLSIEGIETNMKLPVTSKYVALCSLHSWNYTVQPPGMLNVHEGFVDLGRKLDVLGPPQRILNQVRSATDAASIRAAARLADGYSMVRYRVQTGEITAALFRGPFTPTVVPPLAHLNKCSNSGIDLQILDKEVGLVDISYSVAWQVGRTLALGDEGFTAALGRVRTMIQEPAMREAKRDIVNSAGANVLSRAELLADLAGMVDNLSAVQLGDGDGATFEPGGPKKRWFRHRLTRREIPNLSYASAAVKERYPDTALAAATALAASTDGSIFNETNNPVSTDWMLVLSWLVDRMYLAGVPAHYLISDPSHLEPESLRFFYIDPNWVDALLDGALSLGNHLGFDQDRVAIKKALNLYVQSTESSPTSPQIPTYGFYLRSDLVTMFPDLRVTTLPPRPPLLSDGLPDRAPLLRHEIVTDGVMMGLFDRLPGSPEFTSLVFTQPPHQQRFAAGFLLEEAKLGVEVKRQYTVDQPTRETDENRHDTLKTVYFTPDSSDSPFVWGSEPGETNLRLLRPETYSRLQIDTLQSMPKQPDKPDGTPGDPYFSEDKPTSALLAMQLNDPNYNLTVNFETPEARVALMALSMGPDDNAPRTLLRLEPPTVERVAEEDDDGSDDESSPWDGSDDETVYERHEAYQAPKHLLASNAPHVGLLPSVKLAEDDRVKGPTQPAAPLGAMAMASTAAPVSSAAASPALRASSAPASSPVFDTVINSRGTNTVVLLRTPNLAQDLVFSIRVASNKASQWRLRELSLRIELGAPASTKQDRVYLMERYDGPGPAMLSNLRFNVLASNPTIKGTRYLQLRLLPRSSKGWIDMSTVTDMSFLLSLAKVSSLPERTRQLTVKSWADYITEQGIITTVDNGDTLVTVVDSRFNTV
ncbi:hypothetical protein RB595_002090 [Gaeumannomyces hyphopodioides]